MNPSDCDHPNVFGSVVPRSYPKQPLIGIGVVVLRDRDVLLIRRGNEPGYGRWSIPGGCQEVGETVFEAAVREVLEETAIEVRAAGLIDIVDSIRKDDQGLVQYHFTLIEVLAMPVSGEPKAGGDALEATWVDRSQLAPLGLWDETIRIINMGRDMLQRSSAAP
jgi:8-oxo-dGTP diphosphatase